ncbi:Alpha amylase, catalytic domain [Modestobacter sp. DSM 44400]|uniref:alpha-amylase family glycosyl hydrolase n=1 Tax=Modestobacter sp. DSM 44400 TaxID=1550230 RepID=UPI000894747A|nr:alpha-amylase family glycosyl hydrolase [Modestobacter sp. DSM 44400]SDY05587.1 Alpha amylase, catalytic domain [Modestobacter sp. DSM 44400]
MADDDRLAQHLRPDELHLAFNFKALTADWDGDNLRTAIEHSPATVATIPAPACWLPSNHDRLRHVTRYGNGERGTRRARAAALLHLALPGAAHVYNGDELGRPDVDLPDEVLRDPIWERSGHTERGRDACRVPMPSGWGPLTAAAQAPRTRCCRCTGRRSRCAARRPWPARRWSGRPRPGVPGPPPSRRAGVPAQPFRRSGAGPGRAGFCWPAHRWTTADCPTTPPSGLHH